MNGMYGMQNGMMQRSVEEPPAKRFKPGQAQAVMQGNHGTSLIEAMNALEIQSHLETLKVRTLKVPLFLIEPSNHFNCSSIFLPARAKGLQHQARPHSNFFLPDSCEGTA